MGALPRFRFRRKFIATRTPTDRLKWGGGPRTAKCDQAEIGEKIDDSHQNIFAGHLSVHDGRVGYEGDQHGNGILWCNW